MPPLRLELSLPISRFHSADEKIVVITAVNTSSKSIRLPRYYAPGPFDLSVIDAGTGKRVAKGFVSYSTGPFQGNTIDFRKVLPQVSPPNATNETAAPPHTDSDTQATGEKPTSLPFPFLDFVLSDQDPVAPPGLELKPGEKADTDISLHEFYFSIAPGRYFLQAACKVEGQLVVSPPIEFTVAPSPPLDEIEMQHYAKVGLAPSEKAIEYGRAFLRRYPNSALAYMVRIYMLNGARNIRDWTLAGQIAKEIYTRHKASLRRLAQENMLESWAISLWRAGKKKDAETVLLDKHPRAREVIEAWRKEDAYEEEARRVRSTLPSGPVRP